MPQRQANVRPVYAGYATRRALQDIKSVKDWQVLCAVVWLHPLHCSVLELSLSVCQTCLCLCLNPSGPRINIRCFLELVQLDGLQAGNFHLAMYAFENSGVRRTQDGFIPLLLLSALGAEKKKIDNTKQTGRHIPF